MDALGLKFVIKFVEADRQRAEWMQAALDALGCTSRLMPYGEDGEVQLDVYVLIIMSSHSVGVPLFSDLMLTLIPVPFDDSPPPPLLAPICGIYLSKAADDAERGRILEQGIRSLLEPHHEPRRVTAGRKIPFPGVSPQ